ncbi:GEVED domain-containing protein [Flavobacteriales bacterium]|nr:GEVED domain-containing protein [Flavobacteriales bacterium]
MHKIKYILFLLFVLLNQKIKGQCGVDIDANSLQHIVCPNGGSVGSASILQDNYTNYFWENITTGQSINSVGNTSCSNLNAGLYVIFATDPNNQSCNWSTYSDTFEILEASPTFNYTPDQACPDLCNVSVNADMEVAISGVSYTMFFNSNFFPLPVSIQNQCGGLHNYTILADGVSCNAAVIGVSQFATMNLQTITVDQTCNIMGSSEVVITGVGASGLDTYCSNSPQFNDYSIIEDVVFVGDNTSISNNTQGVCSTYVDYTAQSVDVTTGSSYTVDIHLGTCHPQQAWVDLANIFVDWNIDGDFDDTNELVGQINPIQSPSSHLITFNVPSNAIPGQSRMRIVSQSTVSQSSNSAQACDDQVAYFGETEDYTLIVNGSVATPISYLWSDGQNSSVASNLSSGTYYVTVTDANGCTSSDTAIVNGGSSNISVTATFDQTICAGYTPSSLNASSGGVAGTYSWADASNPLVILGTGSNFSPPPLTSTTTYTVTLADNNGCVATDDIVITVSPVPSVSLTAVPNPACEGDDIQLNANTNIPVNLYRFQYNTGLGWQNIITTNTGGWGVNSIEYYNNIVNSTQFRVRVREDWGCTVSSWSPAITVPINNILTPLISHN